MPRTYDILLQRLQIGEKYVDKLGLSVENSVKCGRGLIILESKHLLECQLSSPTCRLIQAT